MHREDGHGEGLVLASRFLALPAPPVVLVERGVEIGPPREDRVAHARRADDPAQAARAGLAHAEQADHVAAVGMEAQGPARARLRARGAAELGVHGHLLHLAVEPVLVPHLADQLPLHVLVAGRSEMRAETPVEALELTLRVAIDGNTPQEDEPAALLELMEDARQVPRKGGEREVAPAEVWPGEAALLQSVDGGVQLGDGAGRERTDPLRRSLHLAAKPCLGSSDHRGSSRNGATAPILPDEPRQVKSTPCSCAFRTLISPAGSGRIFPACDPSPAW